MTPTAGAAEPKWPRWPTWPWLVSAGTWLVFRLQSGPGVWDAGELTAAAVGLGGSHAPGQPLHALLGYLLTLLPLGSMPLRVAVLSAVGELMAAWLVVQITRRLLRRLATEDAGLLREFSAHAAGMGCLLASPMWRQGGRVEVYGLALALTLGAIERLLAWADGDARALRVAALIAALAAALHPPHALAAVAVGATLLLVLRREVLPRSRALVWAGLGFTLGLTLYAYLPLRGYADATLWGDTSTAAGFWRYVSGAAYRTNLSANPQLAALLYLARGAGPAAIVGVVLLLVLSMRGGRNTPRHAWAFIALPAAAALGFCLQPLEPLNPDNIAYAAPATALAIAVGAATLASLRLGRRSRPALACVLASLVALPVFADDLSASGRADDASLETLAGELVDAPPTRALVIVRSDFAGSAFMLARASDEARPDVALLVEGLATSSWHWRSLAAHPLFDGVPVRGSGPTPMLTWVNGAVSRAADSVAIASESDGPVAGLGTVVGPYLVVEPRADASPGALQSYVEALTPELGRETHAALRSDSDVVRGVLRDRALRRARRLLARRQTAASGVAYRQALTFAPEPRLAAFDHLSPPRMPTPPTIRDPDAMLPSEGDAIREAACSLLVAGDPRQALSLLEWDEQRGDTRALLQFAVFEWARGARPEALDALNAFEARAPEWRAEGDELRRRLAQPAPPSPEPTP